MKQLSAPVAAVLLLAWPAAGQPAGTPERALLDRYCVTCHNDSLRTAALALDTLDPARVGDHPGVWEKVVGKLRAGMMPPAGRPRPDRAASDRLVAYLETELDRAAAANPDPRAERRPAAAQRHRVPERHPRSARPRRRRGGAAAGRRLQRRLRQRQPGRARPRTARALSRGGAEDLPSRRRRPGTVAGRRHVHRAVGPEPDRPCRRDAVRHPRRRPVRLQLPGRRRVRAARRAGQELEHQPHRRPARAARRRDPARRHPRSRC